MHSVREFVELAFAQTNREVVWRGKGVDEKGVDPLTGKTLVEIDPRYFRPTEVDQLLGDPSKALAVLGWRSLTSFEGLVQEMVAADRAAIKSGNSWKNRDD
jgi:GDPmannose 4,6-dehydratase